MSDYVDHETGSTWPAPSAGSVCPTCGSEERGGCLMPCWFKPDPWHSAESGKEGETVMASPSANAAAAWDWFISRNGNPQQEEWTFPAQVLAQLLADYHDYAKPLTAPAQGAEELPEAVRIAREWIGDDSARDLAADIVCYAQRYSAQKDAEIAWLKQQQNEGYRIPALEAEIEGLKQRGLAALASGKEKPSEQS